ncbi:MAG TPA: hypothetical protein VF365_07835 [Candidatus Limnocylindria bacterium]
MIGYPTGWTLAVLHDPGTPATVISELVADGVPRDDVIELSGEGSRAGLDRLGSSAGLAARIRRGLQFMTMDQMPDLHVYELAIEQGHAVIGLRIGDSEQRRRAVDVLRRHGAHFINRFGAWATEEIAPWRGPTLDLPQYMRR